MVLRRGRAAIAAILILVAAPVATMAQQATDAPTAPPPPPPATQIDDPPMPLADQDSGAEMPSQILPTPANADQVMAPVLTVDQDQLFQRSAWGLRIQDQLNQEGELLQAENERLVRQLSDEEAALTQQRALVDQAEFRKLAEAFDERATEIRRERAQAVTDLNTKAEDERTEFYRAALPVMGQMMTERGAVAVLDRRTVFVSIDAIDITDALIDRIDAELGDGSDVQVDPPADTPADPPADTPAEVPSEVPSD